MKKAKEEFDGLVQIIREGRNVTFGQMEQLFAQAFLSRFLSRLSSDQERSRANSFYQRNLVEDPEEYYDDELPRLSDDQQIQSELEQTSSIMRTLGVRPTTEDLSHYIEHALRGNDWELLDTVLSLTKEGNLQERIIERIALRKLEDGYVDSYRTLKEQFPALEITSADVTPIYETAIIDGDFQKLREIREETSIAIPEQACQTKYERLLAQGNSSAVNQMQELNEISGIAPKKTRNIKRALGNLYQTAQPREERIKVDDLDELLGIYQDDDLSVRVQKSALEANQTEIFSHAYEKSQKKISEKDIKLAYFRLDKAGDYTSIATIMGDTKVVPRRTIFSRTATKILKNRDFDWLRSLVRIAGTKPRFDQEVIDNVSSSLVISGDIQRLATLYEAGAKIDNEQYYSAACNSLFRSFYSPRFDTLERELNDFLGIVELKPSPSVTAAKLSVLTKQLGEDIQSVAGEFVHPDYKLHPLTPVYRKNMVLHNRFKARVNTLLKRYLSKAKKIRKENTESAAEISAHIDRKRINAAYNICLETILAQALVGDEKHIKLQELFDTLSVPVSRDNLVAALHSHVDRNKRGYNNPEGLVTKIKNAFQLDIDAEVHSLVAERIIYANTNIHESLNYLKMITGHDSFSPVVIEAARKMSVEEFVAVDLREYWALEKLTGKIELSDSEKAEVSKGIISKLKKDPIRYVDHARRIVDMTGVQPQASIYELKDMVRVYFQEDYRTKPSQIASVVNQKLDRDQIFNRTIRLITDNDLRFARELYQDTGIHPTEQSARNFLNRYHHLRDRRIMANRLRYVFGENSGVS